MKEDEQEGLVRVLSHLRMDYTFVTRDTASDPTSENKSLHRQSPPCNEANISSICSADQDGGSNQLKQGPTALSHAISRDEPNEVGITSGWRDSSDMSAKCDFDVTGSSTQMDCVDASNADLPFSFNLPLSNWIWTDVEGSPCSGQTPLLAGENTSYGMPLNIETMENPPDCAETSGCAAHLDTGTREDDNTEALFDQLSNRIGSLQIEPGGHVRYWGPTSNFNLVDMPAPDNLTVHRTVRNDGQEYLDRLGIGKEVPHALEEHLTNLYFAWQDPTAHAVNRPVFEAARASWRDDNEDTPYYSEALQNSM